MSITPAIAPINLLTGAGAVTPANILLPALASTGLSPFDNGSTVVEISGLGQLLSAVSSFQSNLAALAPGTASGGSGTNFGSDLGSLAAEAQNFTDAFNGLANTLNGLSVLGEPLAGQLAAALDTQATATYGGSGFTSLAQIGIDFTPSPAEGRAGGLSVDMAALQGAFATNPSEAFALLSHAASAFGGLAANYVGQAGSALAAANSVPTAETQQALLTGLLGAESGLLGSGTGFFGLDTGTLGLTTLLALASPLIQTTGAPSLTQQILALNEFTLISSLLG